MFWYVDWVWCLCALRYVLCSVVVFLLTVICVLCFGLSRTGSALALVLYALCSVLFLLPFRFHSYFRFRFRFSSLLLSL